MEERKQVSACLPRRQIVRNTSISEFLPLQKRRNKSHSARKQLSWFTYWVISMAPAELSSMKWECDGELSSQDTWNLVKRLTKIEDQHKASDLLHLSSKHVHAKKRWTKE